MSSLFDFDILKGARHVYKPPPPSKPPRPKSTSSLPQPNGTSSKANNIQASNKPTTAKKPAPVSFEEMMKLASKNVTKDDKKETPPSKSLLPPPKPPQSLSKLKPALSSSQLNTASSKSKPANTQTSNKPTTNKPTTKKPFGSEETMKVASKNLTKHDKAPLSKPLLSKSIPALPSSQPNSAPSKSRKGSNTQASKHSMMVQKPPPVRFDEMMKLASMNLTKEDKVPPPSKFLLKSKLPQSSSSKPQSNIQNLNKHRITKKPLPSRRFNDTARFPSRDLFKDGRATSRPLKRPRYEEELDDDDENDSMDDFIVDDEEEDVRKELQSVLRNYHRSDETVWRQREKEIDLRKMNARYQEIDAEEKRSYRIARMEDMIEEKRGSKALQ